MDAAMIDISELTPANEFIRMNDNVDDLKRSIKAIGLINPLIINPDLEVLSGGRRLKALKELGHTQAPCTIYEEGELESFILAIDDNLMRKNLSGTLYEKALADRKVLYEAKYPETKQHTGLKKKERPSFTAATAQLTGESRRTIEKAVARAEGSSEETIAARDRGEILATHVDELIKLPKEDQDKILEVAKGKSSTQIKEIVTEAKNKGIEKTLDNFTEEEHKILTSLKKRTRSLNKIIETAYQSKISLNRSHWLEFSGELSALKRNIEILITRNNREGPVTINQRER